MPLSDVDNFDDMRVVDAIDRATFAQETFSLGVVLRELLTQGLDRDQSIDQHVPREVDRAHPAGTETGKDPISVGDRCADQGILGLHFDSVAFFALGSLFRATAKKRHGPAQVPACHAGELRSTVRGDVQPDRQIAP